MTQILFATYSGLLGGAERVLLECASAAPGAHVVACPKGPLAAAAREAGLTVIELPQRGLRVRGRARHRLLGPLRLGAHALELRRLARDLNPELLFAWGMRSGLAALAAQGFTPLALEHHDFLPENPLAGAAIRRVAARAAVVTVPSRTVADDLDPGGALGSRLHVIAPGVDPALYADIAATPAARVVIVLGAIAPWKWPELALEVVSVARRWLPDLRLRIVGGPVTDDEPLVDELARRARSAELRDVVDVVGPVADPRSELAGAGCLLHCAPREPFGIALLEAMAAGRVVVAPDSGGPREIVTPECGTLYPAGDVEAAAGALVSVLGDPVRAAEMGAAGRERVRTRFTLERTRAGYQQAIEAARPGPPSATARPAGWLELLTVTHNSAGELARLIASIRRQLPGTGLIVVDSGSTDESVSIARSFAGVQVLELDENLGFGRACNRGLELARAGAVGLVNPDVELVDRSLEALADEALQSNRPERLLAPLVLNRDGTRQPTAHPPPAGRAELVQALFPPALLPGPAGVAVDPWRARQPRRVGWAVGAALVARRETFQRLGPFDESLFLYGEDMDLGLRAAEAGIETWFWPTARVLHSGGHASSAAFGGEPFERLARARHNVVARRLGERRARRDDRLQTLTFASRIGAKRLLGREAERERRQLAAVRGLRR
jgi:N-acetylglucosaminyl-diphospho-decaprenol L-rhamnosyltransferase